MKKLLVFFRVANPFLNAETRKLETTPMQKYPKGTLFANIKLCMVLICLLCLIGVACEKYTPQPMNLQGTKWKLVGVFDAKTDTLVKELEPKDCEFCYTITFDDTDSLYFRSRLNWHGGTYEVDYENNKIRIIKSWGTLVGELYEDSRLYEKILYEFHKTQSFSSRENELKWYYNNGKNYSLYKALGL